MAVIAASLSLAMMSLGVPFGTQRPYQTEMYRPGAPASSTVGISGNDGSRVFAVTA